MLTFYRSTKYSSMKPMQMFNLRVLFVVLILVILSIHCQKLNRKDISGNASLNDTVEQNITIEETQDSKENINETISLKTVNTEENIKTSVETQNINRQIEFMNASTHISALDVVNITQDEILSNSSEPSKKISTSCDCHAHHRMDKLKKDLSSLKTYVKERHNPIQIHIYKGEMIKSSQISEPSKDDDKKVLGKGKTKDHSKRGSKQSNKKDDDNLQDHVHVHSKGIPRHNHSKHHHIHSLNNQDLHRNDQNGHSNVKYKHKSTNLYNEIGHDYEPSVSRQRHFKVQETHIHLNIQVSGRNEEDAKEKEHHKKRVDQIKKEGPLEKDLTVKNEIPIFARCDMKTFNSGHNISGTVFLHQLPGQYLKVEVQLQGFSVQSNHTSTNIKEEKHFSNLSSNDVSLNKQLHGFHVHEFGDSSKGCHSMGGHFNPEGVHHGYHNNSHGHVGDWGNIEVDMNGDSNSNFTVQAASLVGPTSILGRGIVVHSQRDDLGKGDSPDSKTTGDAGGRIACCNIVLTKPKH